MAKKQLTEKQGRIIAELYLGKVQKGRITEDQGLNEIRRKLEKEGYDRGSVAWVQLEFTELVRKHGDYRW